MNLLQLTSNSLVKNLPIHRPRSSTIKNLLYLNSAMYAYYLFGSGPQRLKYEHRFAAGPESSYLSLFNFHFSHTSLTQFLFTSGVLYTLGNYHVTAYGCNHFLRLFALSALGGSVLHAIGLQSGATQHVQAGAMAPAAGLIAYHVFRNPGWFQFFLKPLPLLALLTLYGAFYGDRAAIGGISFGYLAFIFGL